MPTFKIKIQTKDFQNHEKKRSHIVLAENPEIIQGDWIELIEVVGDFETERTLPSKRVVNIKKVTDTHLSIFELNPYE